MNPNPSFAARPSRLFATLAASALAVGCTTLPFIPRTVADALGVEI